MFVRVTLSARELVRVRLALLRSKDYWDSLPGEGAKLLSEDYQRLYDLLCGADKEVCHVGCEDEGWNPDGL